MKVLHCFTDPRMGGPQRRTLTVADSLADAGVVSSFLIPDGDSSFARTAADRGFEVHRRSLPRIRRPRRVRDNAIFLATFPLAVRRVRAVVERTDADVVHVNTSYNFTAAVGTRLASDAALVWHFNDTLTPSPIKETAAATAKRMADRIVVTSQPVVDHYGLRATPTERLFPPVDIETYRTATPGEPSVRDEVGVDEDTPLLGLVANLNPIKGVEYAIEAMSEITSDYPEATLVVAGAAIDSRDDYHARLTRLLRREGLTEHVHFLGWRDDVPSILSALDLLVMPSLAESGPMVVPEALAAGCPVVATDVGVVTECFSERELWIVPPESSAALADATTEALDNPTERARRVDRARPVVERNFSIAACTDRHREIYRSVSTTDSGR